jgi:type I restriction-modification system DNA methylase subunit
MSAPPTRQDVADAANVFSNMLSRLRAVEHFAVGRRVLAVVALGRLSRAPIRQVLFGHAHSPDDGGEGHAQLRRLLLDAALQVEADDPALRGVFTDVLIPDAFQTRFLDQNALFAAGILSRLPPPSIMDDFARWFSDRLDQIVLAGPAASEVGTPPPLAELMVELAGIRPGDRVYDPCCGLGGLLALAGRRSSALLLSGSELHPISWALSTLRLRLLGLDARVERGDALRSLEADPADRVLCDPPLGSYIAPGSELRIDVSRPSSGLTRRLDSLFLEKSWNALSSSGRAVVLVSQPTLFRRGAEQNLRARLLESRVIETVIALPPSAVSWTNAELALVILDRSSGRDHIRFIDGGRIQSTVGPRGQFSPSAILQAYADPEERPWSRSVAFSEFLEDNSLVPRRHIQVTAERPTAEELFGRARDLRTQAEERVARINTLLGRLVGYQ